MVRCKFNKKQICIGNDCTSACPIFKATGQQTMFASPPEVIEHKKKKGYTVTRYKVDKKQ